MVFDLMKFYIISLLLLTFLAGSNYIPAHAGNTSCEDSFLGFSYQEVSSGTTLELDYPQLVSVERNYTKLAGNLITQAYYQGIILFPEVRKILQDPLMIFKFDPEDPLMISNLTMHSRDRRHEFYENLRMLERYIRTNVNEFNIPDLKYFIAGGLSRIFEDTSNLQSGLAFLGKKNPGIGKFDLNRWF